VPPTARVPSSVVPLSRKPDPRANLLLAALPTETFDSLRPALEAVPLALGQALYESGGPQRHVFFPANAIVSLLYVLKNGASAEGCSGLEGRVRRMTRGGDQERPHVPRDVADH